VLSKIEFPPHPLNTHSNMDSLVAIVDLQDHVISYLPPRVITCLGKSSRQWEKPCKDAALHILSTAVTTFVSSVEDWWGWQDAAPGLGRQWEAGRTRRTRVGRTLFIIDSCREALCARPLPKGVYEQDFRSPNHLRELICNNKHGDADVFRELKKKFEDTIRYEEWKLADPRFEDLLNLNKRRAHLCLRAEGGKLFDNRIAMEEEKITICRLVDFLQPQPTQAKQQKFIHSIKPSTMIKYLRTLLRTLPRSLANKLCEPLTPEGIL